MKTAIITDIHFGVRNDSSVFRKYQSDFFEQIFFPTLDENNIKTVFILGDVFDRRKYINFTTLSETKKMFFDELEKRNITVHTIVGNHDVTFKNTNRVNALDLTLSEYENVNVHTEPTLINVDGIDIGLVPWINVENYEDSLNFINTCKTNLLFGHFELKGFEMHKGGGECEDGMDVGPFRRFEYVFSGHFHQPSTNGHGIIYLGAPAQFTWADYGCKRGFHLFDLQTRELSFVENTIIMFHKIFYDNEFDILDFDYENLSGKVVRVIVSEKSSQQKFDLFVDSLQQSNPYQLDIVDNTQYHFVEAGIDEEAIKSEDTISLINSYIDGLNISLDSDKLKNMFRELYVEALVEAD